MQQTLKTCGELEFKFDLRVSHLAHHSINFTTPKSTVMPSLVSWTANWNEKLLYLTAPSVGFLKATGVTHIKIGKKNEILGVKKIEEIFKIVEKSFFDFPPNSITYQYTFLNEFKEPIKDDISSLTMSTISDDFSKLLKEEKFSDIVLQCQGGDLKAHRNILSARCEFFEKMLSFDNIESTKHTVQCAFDSDIMFALLQYIYSNKIDPSKSKKLIEAADYYRIFTLKGICEDIVFEEINAENAISTLVFAETHNCDLLKQKSLNYIGVYFEEVTKSKEMLKLPGLGVDKLDFNLFQLIMESFVLNK
ncbi:hypothetical protein ACFFRR_004774 [Megaselia abdita]